MPNLENIIKDETMLNSFDVDYIELETLMWQTGYLTITKVENVFDTIAYHLDIPNQEVKLSLMGSIANFMSKNTNALSTINNIKRALHAKECKEFEQNLQALFASIPYNLFTNNKMYEYEGYYVSLFYAYMKGLGFELVGEDVTNKGRIDITLEVEDAIYIIEFKTDGTNALQQIKDKKYHEKYLSSKKTIYLVGIEFDTKERNIVKMDCERYTTPINPNSR